MYMYVLAKSYTRLVYLQGGSLYFCLFVQPHTRRHLMIIAFITINSGLVPWIQGLCAQILSFRFEIIGGLRSHLLLFLTKKIYFKKMRSSQSKKKEKQLVQDLNPLPSIYIQMFVCTHIRIHTEM